MQVLVCEFLCIFMISYTNNVRFKSLKARCAGTGIVFWHLFRSSAYTFSREFLRCSMATGKLQIQVTSQLRATPVEDAVIDISSPGEPDQILEEVTTDGYAGAGGSAGGIQFKSRRNAALLGVQFPHYGSGL